MDILNESNINTTHHNNKKLNAKSYTFFAIPFLITSVIFQIRRAKPKRISRFRSTFMADDFKHSHYRQLEIRLTENIGCICFIRQR